MEEKHDHVRRGVVGVAEQEVGMEHASLGAFSAIPRHTRLHGVFTVNRALVRRGYFPFRHDHGPAGGIVLPVVEGQDLGGVRERLADEEFLSDVELATAGTSGYVAESSVDVASLIHEFEQKLDRTIRGIEDGDRFIERAFREVHLVGQELDTLDHSTFLEASSVRRLHDADVLVV